MSDREELSKRISGLSQRVSEMHLPRKSDRAGWSSGVHCTVDDELWPCEHVKTHGGEKIAAWDEINDELLDDAVSRVRYGISRLDVEESWLSDLETVITAAYSNRRGTDDDR